MKGRGRLRMGCPPVARVNRRASVPYWLMTSTGSTTLPMDLLIFLPCPSLTCKGHGSANVKQARVGQSVLQHAGLRRGAHKAAVNDSTPFSSEVPLAAWCTLLSPGRVASNMCRRPAKAAGKLTCSFLHDALPHYPGFKRESVSQRGRKTHQPMEEDR